MPEEKEEEEEGHEVQDWKAEGTIQQILIILITVFVKKIRIRISKLNVWHLFFHWLILNVFANIVTNSNQITGSDPPGTF